MQTEARDEHTVRSLLENLDLKFVLSSPNNDYRFEYFTTSIKDRQTGELRLTRTYRLHDLIRGTVTPEPWDTYDLEKQTILVTNLMKNALYRMSHIICGWKVICPTCGYIMQGKNWESSPKACASQNPKKCSVKIEVGCISETLFAET